jgi:elongator complex protein 3
MGGTFLNFNKKYKEDFVMYCFKALNDFSKEFFSNGLNFEKFKKFFELPGKMDDEEREKKIVEKILKLKGKGNLTDEQERNEKSKVKLVGLTVETRSDMGKLNEGNEMLGYGVTRVEIGVQSVYDEVLEEVNRGHTSKDTIESFRILKDLGFKINAHYMLGLGKDLEGVDELFGENYRPDMLKIYPCMVFRGTELYKKWKKGKYKAITTEKASEMIAEIKKKIPEYCRVMRVQRDIGSDFVEAGVDRTNLRQYVEKVMKEKGIKCRCIRCREIGNKEIGKVKLKVKEYKASEGREFFISLESGDHIVGFCRLRFPFEKLRKEISLESGLVRELHVYGESESINKKGKVQHRGFGKKLLKKAEEICIKNGKNKVVVISGVGVRGYYKKNGYKKEGVYMVKVIVEENQKI